VDEVSDILQARARRRERMTPMVVVSAAAHASIFIVLALMSLHAASTPPPQVFTVSFAGSEGPRNGGENPMGGRAVERVAPPETKRNVEPPPPPKPKMALPEPKPAKPRAEATTARVAPPAVKPPVPGGDEIRQGSTPLDTGAKGPGFGLNTGGGGVPGVKLDVSNFCCPDYLEQVFDRIKESWKKDEGRPGSVIVRFTIRRDGSVDGTAIEKSSGFAPHDFEARRAVQIVRLDRLPDRFSGEQLTMHLTFTYER
jgi:TonB family protein